MRSRSRSRAQPHKFTLQPGTCDNGRHESTNWPRNRLLLALPARNLKQLLLELEHIRCQREQVLLDVEGSLDSIFFLDSGVISVMAVCSDGGTIEMATIGGGG